MATDPRDFFNNRISQELEKNQQIGLSTGYDALQEASRRKIVDLSRLHKEALLREKKERDSWAGQLGLNPDGITAGAVNVGEAIAGGFGNTGRSLGAAGNTISGDLTAVDAYAAAQKAAAQNGTVAKDELMKEIERRKQADANPGVVSAVQNVAGAMIDNPQGSAEFIAEQAPNSLVSLGAGWAGAQAGAAGGAAVGSVVPGVGTAIGGVVGGTLGFLSGMFLGNALLETGGKAMEKASDGGFTDAKRSEAINEGTVKGAVITGVDALTLGAGGKLAKTMNKAAIEAGARAEARVLSNAGVDITDMAAVQAALSDPLLRGASKAAGRAAAKEVSSFGSKAATAATGLTMETAGEGVGEYAGEVAATGKADVYDAVLEAAAGFTQSVPEAAFNLRRASGNDLDSKGISKADLSIPDPVVKKAKEKVSAPVAGINEAIASGDVSGFLDEKSPSYAPDQAVAALQGNSQLPDATPETKQANLQKATSIVEGLQTKRDGLKEELSKTTAEGMQQLLDANRDSWSAETIQAVEEEIQALKDSPTDPKAIARLENQLARVEGHLTEAQQTLTNFNEEAQSTEVDVAAESSKISAADPVASQAAAEKIINLSMAIPERLDVATAERLASDETNGLTTQQRSFFRAFTKARVAENVAKSTEKVSSDVFEGSTGKGTEMVGINQYRSRLGTAMTSGNQAIADAQLKQMEKFVGDHEQKAKVTAQAYKSASSTGREVQVRSNGKQGWFIHQGTPLSEAALRAEGGLLIHRNSGELVAAIGIESDALTSTAAELRAAYDVKFNQSTSEVQNVENVSKAPSRSEDSTDSAQAKAKTEDGTTEASGDARQREVVGEVQRSEEAGVTAVNEEAPASSANTVEDQGQLQSTEKDNTDTEAVSPITQKTPEGTEHKMKKFGDFFTQSAGRDDSGSKRPLVAVKNFMTGWAEKTIKISEFLKSNVELTDTQRTALAAFAVKAREWAPLIAGNLRPTHNELFNYEDPIRYLVTMVDGKADIDDNIKTAISAAVFAFVSDQAGRSLVLDSKAINSVLGRQGDAPVSDRARRTLETAGLYQSALVDSLGTKVMDALGFKLTKTAPQDMLAKLRASLGAHALKLMEDTEIVQRNSIPAAEIAALRAEGREDSVEETQLGREQDDHYFYSLTSKNYELVGTAKQISDVLVGSKNVIQNLFGIEAGIRYPSLEPVTTVQKKSDTGMGVPSLLKRVFEQKQTKDAWYVSKDPMKVLGSMTEEQALEMIGVVDITNENVHSRNVRSQKAKNDGLVRQFKQFMDWVGDEVALSEKGMDQEIYLTPEMWKQQRAGLANTVGNPQTSKVVRWLMSPKEWTTTVSMEDLQGFKLRVAEGFGRKTEKSVSSKSVAWLDQLMQEPMMIKGVKAMQQSLYGAEINAQQQRDIVNAVKAGGEKMHSFAALLAYAHYQQALDTGAESFTTNLMGEVDGVSNGSILNHALYGAGETVDELKQTLERGGIYTADSEAQSYNEWYDAGNRDIYEANAKLVDEAIAQQAESDSAYGTLIAAIWSTSKVPVDEEGTVTKGGRNMLKTALNPLNYGSGFKSILRNMSAAYVDGIYAQIEEFSKKGSSQEAVDQFVASLNVLLANGGQPTLQVGRPISFYMGYTLSKGQTKALEKVYADTVGKTTISTIKTTFAPLMGKTKILVSTTKLAYDLYAAVYQAARVQMIKDLGIPIEKGYPIHDLSTEQENQLTERLSSIAPLMHTAMSTADDNVNNGVILAKKERGIISRPNYSVAVKFGRALSTGKKQMTVPGQGMQQAAPGVMAVAASTQALDSNISHATQEGRNILNIHDAVGDGIGSLPTTAAAMNENTFNVLMNYSPLGAARDALMGVVRGIVAMDQAGLLTAEAKASLAAMDSNVGLALYKVASAAFEADKMKLEVLSQVTAVDQYAFDGGSFKVEDRQAVLDLLNSLVDGLSQEDEAAMFAFMDIFAKNSSEKSEELKAAAAQPERTITSVFGALGTPAVKSDGDLVQFFTENPDTTAADVIGLLSAQGRLSAINRKLLQLVSRVVKPGLSIRFVTPDMDEADVLAKAGGPSRGWYVAAGGKEAIYVLSPAFKSSGLTAELMLHELIHAAVAQTIDSPTAAGKELVAELDALRIKAQEYAQAAGLNQFADALVDVQEFVAWGMTNLEFQRDVLTKITFESKTRGNALITGMQKFISTLTELLFKKPDAAINNGLEVLISNTSGLFLAAAQAKESKGTLNLSMSSMDKINSYSTMEIFQALDTGAVAPVFQAKLAELLTGIVETLHGPFGAFAAAMRKTEASTPMDVWLKALETGNAPFASSIIASGFAGSDQEIFAMQQVEATVKAALEGNEAMSKMAYKQLSQLYTEVRAKLKPSDFASQEDYDFVFKMESDNGDRSDYLARFAAIGLANAKMNKLLQFDTAVNTKAFGEGKTITERLENIFEKIVAFFSEKITHAYGGQRADDKLMALVDQLVDIEARKRHLLQTRAQRKNYLAPIEDKVKEASDYAREKISEFAGSELVRKNSNAFVRAAGGLARTYANDQVELFMDGIKRLRDQEFKGRQGFAAGLLNDLKGPLDQFNRLLRETKRHEQLRKNIITQQGSLALRMFANGKNLSSEAKAGISAVFMRTGLHHLVDHMTLAEIEDLLGNDSALQMAIESFEDQLTTGMKDMYIRQAAALGYFKATGRSRSPVLMLNAHLISRMAGTQYKRLITESEAQQAEPVIAALASLYALKYSKADDVSAAKEVFRTENARTDGNGVAFLLNLHKQLEEESLQRLFKGNPALMVHGYTPEILNPHTAIKIADAEEGAILKGQGYSEGAKVGLDNTDPDNKAKRIYVLRDGGLAPWLSGVFSLSGMQAKGSKKHNGYVNVNTQGGLANASMQADITGAKLKALTANRDPHRDLTNDLENHMVPVFNEMGDIVNWRYMMAEHTKNTLLERDNSFEKLVGVLAGSIYDKETTREHNSVAVRALRDQYEAEYATRKDSYIFVGERSTDPEMRAIWALLPEDTKRDIRATWGRNGMMVRSDSLDIMFGYRKYSLSQIFEKDADARNKLESLFVNAMETVLAQYAGVKHGLTPEDAQKWAKRAAVYVTRGERAWQALVQEAKDIIVVKTGFVMIGNIWSNLSLLAMSGVSMKDILQHHLVAMKGATAYHDDSRRLADLQTMLQVGYSGEDEVEIQREIVRLKDALARNPVRELIDAGLMPSIVEDVAEEEDPFSFKSEFARKTEAYTSKLNPTVKSVARAIYMTHDTKAYQTLSRITQLSDFVARYTLYQHLISREKNPLSKAEAIQEASDSFVNYDIPMHRALQYTDDMGITAFTKYFLRIQRVLLKLTRENPARVFTTLLVNNYFSLGPIVLDSSFVNHLGNSPLGSGAFMLPGALDELATVNAAMAVVK